MTSFTERMLGGWQDGEQRNIHRDMMQLTLEITAKTLLDTDLTADADGIRRALNAVMDFDMDLVNWLLPYGWSPMPAAFRYRQAVRTFDRIIYDIRHGQELSYRLRARKKRIVPIAMKLTGFDIERLK
ncbi:MAG: hypothetical protein FJ147_18835, partial [Deltaproteobacteria bacterium]|nr:hypothetical protein [Deltaproteobacteria bacterium]